MLLTITQATNGILIESNAPFWDWLIPLMYGFGVIAVLAGMVTLALAAEGDISAWWPSIVAVIIVAIFIVTGNIHSNLEKTDGYAAISHKIYEVYGIEVSADELKENEIHEVLNRNSVSKIILANHRQSRIVRDDDTGYFEQEKDAKYSIIVDGRVIELVQVKEDEERSLFIPLDTVK